MREDEVEILDAFLDGELNEAETGELQSRLLRDGALSVELTALQADRELRTVYFEAMEAGAADITGRIQSEIRRRRVRAMTIRRAAVGFAAAACVAGAFLGGWIGGVSRSSNVSANAPEFKVEVRDQSGELLGIQEFKDIEKAQEFADDLQAWQKRQQRVLSGEVSVRSGQF